MSLKQDLIALAPAPVAHQLRLFKNVALARGEPEFAFACMMNNDMDLAMDVGANLGVFSDMISRKARDVISVEPSAPIASYLRKVLPRNCFVVEKALSDAPGDAILKTPQVAGQAVHGQATLSLTDNKWDDLDVESAREAEVPLTTIDAVMSAPAYADRRLDFVKIDVEGHEWAVIRGAERTIARHRPVFLVETEYRHNAPVAEIFRFFTERNYKARYLVEGALSPIDAAVLKSFQRREDLQNKIAHQSSTTYVNNVFFLPAD